MANYGQLIDAYDPTRDSMYLAFAQYFNNPTMTKIKNVDGFSVYMSKAYCLLNKECRYLVTFIHVDGASIGTTEEFCTLKWVSLQTRTLADRHDLPAHAYTAVGRGPLLAKIVRTNTGSNSSTYSCEAFPLTVTLLHTEKGSNAYQDNGNLIAALETWQTIITINEG
jgi:hypothetical protein